MKKEMNSKSKRKWIMGGVIAFCSVALLSTGFAVWQVGVNQASKEGEISVSVDTAQNNSVKIDAALSDSTIKLAESAAINTGFVTSDATDGDFSVTFSSFEITMGSDAYTSNSYKFVKFSIQAAAGDYVDNKTASGANSFSDLDSDRGDSYFDLAVTYMELESESDSKFTAKKTNAPYSFDLTSKTVELFKWGSFFDNSSPCTYYNKLLTAEANQTPENAQKVTDELTAMNTKYTNKKISLKIELVASAS